MNGAAFKAYVDLCPFRWHLGNFGLGAANSRRTRRPTLVAAIGSAGLDQGLVPRGLKLLPLGYRSPLIALWRGVGYGQSHDCEEDQHRDHHDLDWHYGCHGGVPGDSATPIGRPDQS